MAGGGPSGTTDDESVPAAGLVRGTQVMREEELRHGDPIGCLDWRQILPFEAAAASDRRGWVGLEAARCRAEPAFEPSVPAITHHRLVLVSRPAVDLDLRYEGVKRHRPTPAGSITLVPAGSPVWARSSGRSGTGRPGRRARPQMRREVGIPPVHAVFGPGPNRSTTSGRPPSPTPAASPPGQRLPPALSPIRPPRPNRPYGCDCARCRWSTS
jgi:hypothetical protein